MFILMITKEIYHVNNHSGKQTARAEMREYADNMGVVARAAKRVADVLGSLAGLVLASPLMLFISMRLKLNNEGSVIFSQERIGLHGKPFMIYKFRTFSVHAENDGPRLAPENADCLTSYGRRLRERHLDELPQLWNVLKGDMSLVGPRPERKFFIDRIMQHDSRYEFIYSMRPGLTSDATLRNGYTDTMEKMLRRLQMDLHYLQTRTLGTDVRIIVQTARMLLAGKKF